MLTISVAVLSSLPVAAAPAMGDGPTLTLPDGSVLQLPPGTRAFGPRGPATPPEPPPPPAADQDVPRQDTPRQDPPATAAERRKKSVDELYGRLAQAKDAVEAQAISDRITDLFLHSGSDTADLLMDHAVVAMAAKDYPTALSILDKLVMLRPRWAEAWNKRATVRYLADDDVGAMGDIGQVLLLEPRHIGALSGMGLILHRNGNDRGALSVFRKALAIDPKDTQVQTLIDQLGPDVEGREL